MSREIAVLGAGVIGLTTACVAQQQGWKVTILTRTHPNQSNDDPHYASSKAGAHWYSFASPNDQQQQICDTITFRMMYALAIGNPTCGVTIRRGYNLFPTRPETWTHPWWSQLTPQFHYMTESELSELPCNMGKSSLAYAFGISYDTVMINVSVYLSWLLSTFQSHGGLLHIQHVTHIQQVHANIIINCTGLGSHDIKGVEDHHVYPTRGATVIVHAPHIQHIIRTPDTPPDSGPTYILPRGDGTVVCGGTYQAHNTSSCQESDVDDIISRCARLEPSLATVGKPGGIRILSTSMGLRPTRKGEVRLEVEKSTSPNAPLIIHNYGHGGYGYQSSWGCAMHACALLHTLIHGASHPQSSTPIKSAL